MAITLVDFIELGMITRIGKRYSIPFTETTMPTDEDVAEIVSERITALLEAQYSPLPQWILAIRRRYLIKQIPFQLIYNLFLIF